MFQSPPGPRAGRNQGTLQLAPGVAVFQSTPGPRAGRNRLPA